MVLPSCSTPSSSSSFTGRQRRWGAPIWAWSQWFLPSKVLLLWSFVQAPFWMTGHRFMQWGKVAHPWGTRGRGGGWSYIHSTEWSKKGGGGSPCAVKGQKGLLWAAAFTFFSVISLSLPPNLSLPHSAEESASSKETLVDSRKSGCCRSDKNLVGVSVWVEPAEEQRWLHHSSLSPKEKKKKTSNTYIYRDTLIHLRVTHTHTHTRHVEQAQRHSERHGGSANQRQELILKNDS